VDFTKAQIVAGVVGLLTPAVLRYLWSRVRSVRARASGEKTTPVPAAERPSIRGFTVSTPLNIIDSTELTSKLNKDYIPTAMVTPPDSKRKYNHYFKEVPKTASHVDVYWVLLRWAVWNPCVAHAVKKLLNAGQRGSKDFKQDLTEARDSLNRALELLEEE
jgi:hypothetical protein